MNIVKIHAFFKQMWHEASEAQSETALDVIRDRVTHEYEALQQLEHHEPLLVEFDYQCSLLGPQLDQWQKEIMQRMVARNFDQLREHRRRALMVASAENLGAKSVGDVISDPFVRPYLKYMEMLCCRAIN